MCVFMHACMRAWMYVCLYVCMSYRSIHACLQHAKAHAYTDTCTHAYMQTFRRAPVHACIHTGSRTDLIVCLLAYLLACVYNYTHICTYADLCTYLVCGVYCKLLRFVVPRAADREWGMFLPAAYAMPQGVSGSGCRVLSFNRASDPLAVRMSRT